MAVEGRPTPKSKKIKGLNTTRVGYGKPVRSAGRIGGGTAAERRAMRPKGEIAPYKGSIKPRAKGAIKPTGTRALTVKPTRAVTKYAKAGGSRLGLKAIGRFLGKISAPLGAALGAMEIGRAGKAAYGAYKAAEHARKTEKHAQKLISQTGGGKRALPGARAPRQGAAMSKMPKAEPKQGITRTTIKGAAPKQGLAARSVKTVGTKAPRQGIAKSKMPKAGPKQGTKWKSASGKPGKFTSFEKAFSAARREAKRRGVSPAKTKFSYKGKIYTARYKGE